MDSSLKRYLEQGNRSISYGEGGRAFPGNLKPFGYANAPEREWDGENTHRRRHNLSKIHQIFNIRL